MLHVGRWQSKGKQDHSGDVGFALWVWGHVLVYFVLNQAGKTCSSILMSRVSLQYKNNIVEKCNIGCKGICFESLCCVDYAPPDKRYKIVFFWSLWTVSNKLELYSLCSYVLRCFKWSSWASRTNSMCICEYLWAMAKTSMPSNWPFEGWFPRERGSARRVVETKCRSTPRGRCQSINQSINQYISIFAKNGSQLAWNISHLLVPQRLRDEETTDISGYSQTCLQPLKTRS